MQHQGTALRLSARRPPLSSQRLGRDRVAGTPARDSMPGDLALESLRRALYLACLLNSMFSLRKSIEIRRFRPPRPSSSR
jgi:hypothetical protein